jgi:hypothetical protein
MPTALDVLTDLNLRLGAAESKGDKQLLDDLLAPELAFRRANGQIIDRETFLKAVKPSAHRETRIESISLLGLERAIVTCIVSVKNDPEQHFHNARLFVRSTDGNWKLLGWANEPA